MKGFFIFVESFPSDNCHKMKHIVFFLFLFGTIACKQAPKGPSLQYIIDDLTTDIVKQEFLEVIYKDDQRVRTNGHKEREVNTIDASNLEKIEAYLEKWGHPSKEIHGRKAADAPWLVIHHQPTLPTPEKCIIRRKHFPIIYQAYLDGHIEDGAISFYLNRIYQSEKGQRFEIESPYMPQEELDQLMSALNLRQ